MQRLPLPALIAAALALGVSPAAASTTQRSSTPIVFGSPVTAAAFAASQKAASKGVAVVTVHGLGNAAWAVKAGNGLAVLSGTLDIVISAPSTPAAELEALARKIL